ncbi:MAG: type II toxin-antitoxin system VapC family toxin [Bryobacteraceae bacterium]
MITAIDTNILLDILIPNDAFCEASAQSVLQSASCGPLLICDIVYAELCVHFERRDECDRFLASTGILVQSLSPDALFAASRAWRTYRKQGGARAHILPDFFVAAHAQRQATRLLSRDRGFYRKFFPQLSLLDPSQASH